MAPQIAGQLAHLGIVQTGQRDPFGLHRFPIVQVVAQMPVEIQIVLQKENIIHTAFQALFQGPIRTTRLPLLVIVAVAFIELDEGNGDNHQQRQTRCAYRALKKSLERGEDYVLFLEDDLDFNRHLRHNLHNWEPVKAKRITLASLYNPKVRELACDLRSHARIVAPKAVFGSQAFLISRDTLEYVLRRWHEVAGMQDIKISRL